MADQTLTFAQDFSTGVYSFSIYTPEVQNANYNKFCVKQIIYVSVAGDPAGKVFAISSNLNGFNNYIASFGTGGTSVSNPQLIFPCSASNIQYTSFNILSLGSNNTFSPASGAGSPGGQLLLQIQFYKD